MKPIEISLSLFKFYKAHKVLKVKNLDLLKIISKNHKKETIDIVDNQHLEVALTYFSTGARSDYPKNFQESFQ